MIYIVTYRNKSGIPEMEKISRGFSCTPDELPQEIATRLHIKKEQIYEISWYSCHCAADEVIAHHYRKEAYRILARETED